MIMAGQSHGFDNTVVIAKETTFGTVPATGYKWAGIVESFEPEENNNVDQRMSLGVRAPLMLRVGAKEVDGSMDLALQNGRLIALALGKEVISGDATAGFTHTLTPVGAGTEMPSFTVQNNNALHGLLRNYAGGKVDSFTISASAEEAVMLSADMLFSHVEDTGTPAAVVAELENYFMFYEGTVFINGVATTNVTEFELEVSNNLERRFVLNGVNRPARIEEGNLEITASLTMDLIDKATWTAFKSDAVVSMELRLVDVANAKHAMTFTLTGGLYDTNAIASSAEDLQEQEMEAVFTGMTVVVKDSNATLL